MSGPYDGQQPGQASHPQQPPPSQSFGQPPPSQPFEQPPSQPFGQPVPWRPVEPPQAPFQPYGDRSFSSVRGLGTAASILIGLVALGEALFAASDWYTYRVVKDYVEGAVKDPARLDRADLIATAATVGYLVALLAAGVVFIVWLWRARSNAELLCQAPHRRGRGWIIGGWCCPIVNLWFPKQVVDDVIAASDPRTPPRASNLQGLHANGLLLAWWITWVASLVIGNMGGTDYASALPDVSETATAAGLSTIGAVAAIVSAVLAIRVIHLVNRLQLSRPWIPWWATDAWAEPARQPYGQVPPWLAH